MKKTLGLSFTFVGTVIGAGFATGREIQLFFSECSLFSVILAGILLGLFCYVFLMLSMEFGDVFSAFGIFKKGVKAFSFVANFCVLCATLAGSGEVFYSLFSVKFGSVVTALLCLLLVLFGLKYVKNANLLIVPIIIILVLTVFFSDRNVPIYGKYSLLRPFSYASMNLVTGGFLIGSDSERLTRRECLITAVSSGAVLTLLLVAVYSVTVNASAEMPFIEKAEILGLGTVGNVVLYLAMLTTVIGTLSVCARANKTAAVVIISCALLVSSFGFSVLVDAVYPIVGAVGGAISVAAAIILIHKKFGKTTQGKCKMQEHRAQM